MMIKRVKLLNHPWMVLLQKHHPPIKMKNKILRLFLRVLRKNIGTLSIFMLCFFIYPFSAFSKNVSKIDTENKGIEKNGRISTINKKTNTKIEKGTAESIKIPSNDKKSNSVTWWLIAPFLLLLAMIATGPLLYARFWHKYYAIISCILASIVVGFYMLILKNLHTPIASLFEYIQFISLISALYIAASGVLIKINTKATPLNNTLLLLFGAILSNFIGTTGASMLLIKPFIRLNKGRVKIYHIIFFIFMISNVGGALTAIGDPPLFLGFLKGVPFSWTIINNFSPWAFALTLLSAVFFIIDSKNTKKNKEKVKDTRYPKFNIKIVGKKNFLWLILIICSVFFDPNIFSWIPAIIYHGHKHSFLREIIFILICFYAYKKADKTALKQNDFSFEPLKEVIFIFIGIFGTMAPALEIISVIARSDAGKAIISPNTLYWGTGLLSSFLDNAPTYLNFLTASMGAHGANITNITDVQKYAQGEIFANSISHLRAISIAAVFFGAMTYIGNGPNFMVKSIAEKNNIKMPTFFGYIFKYSLTVLLPVLFIVWIIFFRNI